ncbi:unnamed protein product [Arctogadus glacialis]
MQGTPQEGSRDPPAPPAASQCGPHSLMFRPKGGGVLSSALHLRSAPFLCLSAQHAFISSPGMNSEWNRAGGGGVLVPDHRQLLNVALVWRGALLISVEERPAPGRPGGPSTSWRSQHVLEVPARPGGPSTSWRSQHVLEVPARAGTSRTSWDLQHVLGADIIL